MATLKLAYDADANLRDGRPVLVLLHGFTQDRTAWDGVRDGLRRIGPTVAVDLIGHGASPKPDDPEPYRMDACLGQLDALLATLGVSRAWWVGYSMGGRTALHMAVRRPERVDGLVLISATAGFRELEARAERMRNDEALADRLPGWGIEAFVDYWLALPLFEGLSRLPQHQQDHIRRQRLTNDPVALGHSLRGMGTGATQSLWGNLRELNLPTLVMAGELDERYCTLARSMVAALPQAHLSILPDCGHAVLLEGPERFQRALVEFFQRLEG